MSASVLVQLTIKQFTAVVKKKLAPHASSTAVLKMFRECVQDSTTDSIEVGKFIAVMKRSGF